MEIKQREQRFILNMEEKKWREEKENEVLNQT